MTISTGNLRYSPKKFRFIADQIAGLSVEEAIKQMEFSSKKPARRVLNSLVLARNNAKLQEGFNPDKLIVSEAWVGKGKYQKGIRYHARGRAGIMTRPRSHMKIVLKEKEELKEGPLGGGLRGMKRSGKGWKLTKRVWQQLHETRPIYNPKPYYTWW